MKYTVGTLRDAGLEAKWDRSRRGAPMLFARDPQAKHAHQREKWWVVNRAMWQLMGEDGIREGFEACTLFGDMFSVPA